jgi:hypothetical protein
LIRAEWKDSVTIPIAVVDAIVAAGEKHNGVAGR